ncbi:MAG: hypothetical protein AAFR87_24540 [Bacteroidota bacterium]
MINESLKSKIWNFLLLISSLIGYLEWGGDNQAFLFQLEGQILSKLFTEPGSIIHPLIILPVLGQLFLLIGLFQKQPNKRLVYMGIGSIGVLLGLISLIGILNSNLKILTSTLPFITIVMFTIKHYRSMKLSAKREDEKTLLLLNKSEI